MSDGSLENYRSLHGLPELAGVADLAGGLDDAAAVALLARAAEVGVRSPSLTPRSCRPSL